MAQKKQEPMHGMEELGEEPKRIPREEDAQAMPQQGNPMQTGEPMHSMTELGGEDRTPMRDLNDNPSMFSPEASGTATNGVIGPEEVGAAFTILKKYKEGKANLENQIIENERWWKLRQWDMIGKSKHGDKYQPEPKSAWLHNTITNLHADCMDNYPEPTVLPRGEADKDSARNLTDIVPRIMEMSHFPMIYSDVSYYKLKFGTGVYSCVWDSSLNNGLGDVSIRKVDLLNLYWQSGVTDIQKSRNFFFVEAVDKDEVAEMYPFIDEERIRSNSDEVAQYVHDESIETEDKCLLVDWYYKKNVGGKKIVHYCKFVGDQVIYASENDPECAERGYYDHGKYPFFFDVLFPLEDMPVGFGYIDICKSPQIYIDKLDQSFLKHAVIGSKARFFIRNDGSINKKEYADLENDFVSFNGANNPNESIMPIEVPTLPGVYVDLRSLKIDEMKETSGNRDVSQGGTTAGITAASAIAALQEAGSKRSRDMIKHSYFVMEQIYECVIELKRQFDKYPTSYRVTDQTTGAMKFTEFSGADIAMQEQPLMPGQTEPMYRKPEFDIKVVAQKASAFSTAAANERAKEMYSMGFFKPELADQALACLEMMNFEGIDKVREKISENKTLFQKLQEMTQLAMVMAQQIDEMTGTNYAVQIQGLLTGQTVQGDATQTEPTQNERQLQKKGDVARRTDEEEEESSVTANARQRTADASAPR